MNNYSLKNMTYTTTGDDGKLYIYKQNITDNI